jgi:hypothetical protein
MWLQIEPEQVLDEVYELAVLAATAASLLSGLVPDEFMKVEGECDEHEARAVVELFDYVYDQVGAARVDHGPVVEFLRRAADELEGMSSESLG